VRASYARLAGRHDLIVVEGAGSPAEPNFLRADLVNMAVARLARAPVVLVGDLDRGGVFASLVGTLAILPARDRARVRGFVLNRFRGDAALLRPAIAYLERRTRRPVLGVVPHLGDLHLPEEDGVALEHRRPCPAPRGGARRLARVAVVRLPHVANFTDFAPLDADPALRVAYVDRPAALGPADAAILPGSKDTLADLGWLAATGWLDALRAHHARGGTVGGICGGFQMLGLTVADPHGLEGGGRAAGLGLLPVETVLERDKVTRRVHARLAGGGEPFEAYEIHLGRTSAAADRRGAARAGREPVAPLALVADGSRWRPEGARSADGRAWGTYLHGLLDAGHVRRALLGPGRAGPPLRGGPPSAETDDFRTLRERQYDRLAAALEAHVDLAALERLAGRRP
jgi:adenosylcobyric acid synthase